VLRAPFFIGGTIVMLAGLLIGFWVTDASIAMSRERAATKMEPTEPLVRQ
jgi:hypothetical protein